MVDTKGIEPRASRMLNGCDTITPCARMRLARTHRPSPCPVPPLARITHTISHWWWQTALRVSCPRVFPLETFFPLETLHACRRHLRQVPRTTGVSRPTRAPRSTGVRLDECHARGVSRSKGVTLDRRRARRVSRLTSVTLQGCHGRRVSRLASVTLDECHARRPSC